MYVWMNVCMYVCNASIVYVWMYVFMYVCMYVCMYEKVIFYSILDKVLIVSDVDFEKYA